MSIFETADQEMDMMGEMEGYGMEEDMDYGMEQQMDYGDQQDMEQVPEYGMEMDYGVEEESINFDENPEFAGMPPLDKMRKIRRDILKTINDFREAHQAPSIYVDVMANRAATDYAHYLLENPENPEKADELCKAYNVSGEVKTLVGFAILDEDEDHQGPLHEQFMDAHGLLLELENEVGILVDGGNTHIGVGFAMSNEQVRVVEIVSKKDIMINQINEAEDGGVEARGVVLNREIGLYAARLVAANKMNKDIKAVGPSNI